MKSHGLDSLYKTFFSSHKLLKERDDEKDEMGTVLGGRVSESKKGVEWKI